MSAVFFFCLFFLTCCQDCLAVIAQPERQIACSCATPAPSESGWKVFMLRYSTNPPQSGEGIRAKLADVLFGVNVEGMHGPA